MKLIRPSIVLPLVAFTTVSLFLLYRQAKEGPSVPRSNRKFARLVAQARFESFPQDNRFDSTKSVTEEEERRNYVSDEINYQQQQPVVERIVPAAAHPIENTATASAENDDDDNDDFEAIFENRRQTVAKGCRKYYGYDAFTNPHPGSTIPKNSTAFGRTVISDRFKFTFCMVPKVASQNMRRMMMQMERGHRLPSRPIKGHLQEECHEMWITEADVPKTKDFAKIMFVRHPLERLISAWRFLFAYKPYMKTRKPKPKKDRKSLKEFFEFLADQSDTHHPVGEIHWLPYITLCDPCRVSYDYIGRFENLDNETRYIMNKLTLNTASRYLPPPSSSSFAYHKAKLLSGDAPAPAAEATTVKNSTSLVDFYGEQLDPQLVKRVLKKYKADFAIFGFDMPDL